MRKEMKSRRKESKLTDLIQTSVAKTGSQEPIPSPARCQLLSRAREITGADREITYGNPGRSMECIGQLQKVIRHFYIERGPHQEGYLAALNMIAVKLGRAICGPAPGDDTFIDLAAYGAIAGEILQGEE